MNSTGKYSHLFTPITIGNVTFKNRIFSAPTSLNWGAVDGNLTPETIAYYELKAKGGAAVVTMGESITHTATGKSHDRQIELDNPTCMVGLAQLARAIKRHGAVPSAELSHGGKWGGLVSMAGSQKAGRVAYGASAEDTPQGHVREMPRDLALEVCESFGKGAQVLKQAGFEMCMVHAGHGWLFGQFLSLRTNHRTDEFGGSFENRAKPLLLALDSIRKHVGKGFPIEVRISGDEFIEGGLTLEDGIKLAKLIEDRCDLINVSAGMHENLKLYIRTHPTQFISKCPNVYLAQAIRKEVHVPISTVGAIVDPEAMEEIITSGKADIVELGRPLLADPYLPQKLRTGREKDITKCLRCMNCFGESLETSTTTCTVNPVIGNELNEWIARSQPTTPKKVIVIGGGPGGMEAAVTAAQRGHRVVLYEKSGELGGSLKFSQSVDFKYGLWEFAKVLERRVRESPVELHLNTSVTKELIEAESPDVLMIAVGSSPVKPPILGIDLPNVHFAEEIYGKESLAGQNVTVLGGGLVGCETAAHLARMGRQVTIVEMRPDVAMDSDCFYRTAVKVDLEKNGVRLLVCAVCKEITKEGMIVKKEDGTMELVKSDSVLCAVGYHADHKMFEEFCQLSPIVQMVGDCRRPGKVKNAVSDGYYEALDI